MFDHFSQQRIEGLFDAASISIGGNNPWDIRVYDPRWYRRVLFEGNLGLGESYMDGWWDCDALDESIYRLLCSNIEEKVLVPSTLLNTFSGKIFNHQTPSRSFTVGKHHYDAGNDLFEAMLDKHMIYSCAWWEGAENLDEAQENKLGMIFSKLDLKPDMHLLDIGCGWGGAARFAAEQYGAQVVGITVSEQQAELARQRCAGLPVEIRFMDYRDIDGSFDRICSIGMLEHVGHKNYRTFFDVARRCLKPDGRLLVQTIGGNQPVFGHDTWMNRYIFPNSILPSASQIASGWEGRFVLEDWHAFGHDYYLTLKAWHRNFESHWPELQKNYSERFHRMWRYYLMSCAGAFRARSNQLWQVVLSPSGIKGTVRIPHGAERLTNITGRGNGRPTPAEMREPEPWLHQESRRSSPASSA